VALTTQIQRDDLGDPRKFPADDLERLYNADDK
jgi:hypothetical protein